VRFSVAAQTDPKIAKAIAGIAEEAWTPIRYPRATFDEDQQRWIPDAKVAEVAEVPYTAFPGKKAHRVTARLHVRRVRRRRRWRCAHGSCWPAPRAGRAPRWRTDWAWTATARMRPRDHAGPRPSVRTDRCNRPTAPRLEHGASNGGPMLVSGRG
jgi:hypothetical protein